MSQPPSDPRPEPTDAPDAAPAAASPGLPEPLPGVDPAAAVVREPWRRRTLIGCAALSIWGGVWVLLLASGAADALDAAIGGFDPAAPLAGPMRDLTSFGSATLVTLFALGAYAVLSVQRRRRDALQLALAAAGSGLWVETLKPLYARARPDALPALTEWFNASFPSGHTLMSAALYPTLAVLFGAQLKAAPRATLFAAALLLVLTVGLSRIYLRVHYPTDVIGGAVFGLLWAWIAHCGLRALLPSHAGGAAGPDGTGRR